MKSNRKIVDMATGKAKGRKNQQRKVHKSKYKPDGGKRK